MPAGSRHRCTAAGLALAVLATAPSETRAEPARAACTAALAGGRVLVNLDLDGFFDRELLRLVRLGLQGRIELEVSVVRRRRFWFDDEAARPISRESVVAFAKPVGRYELDGRALPDPAHIAFDRLALGIGAEAASNRPSLRVEVKAKLQVVTAASLGKMASWLAGGEKSEERSALSANLLRTLANDLVRSASATCGVDAAT